MLSRFFDEFSHSILMISSCISIRPDDIITDELCDGVSEQAVLKSSLSASGSVLLLRDVKNVMVIN